jgi:hypothetical protein
MELDGPLNVRIVDKAASDGRELELTFKAYYRALDHQMRIIVMQKYISDLGKQISMTPEGAERQGMAAIQQLAEQLLPYIIDDSIPLEETLVVDLHPVTSPGDLLQRS